MYLKELTNEELHKFHIRLWDFMSKNPDLDKDDWEGWRGIDDDAVNLMCPHYCFACYSCNTDCKKCPLDWPGNITCTYPRSLYHRWMEISTHYINSTLCNHPGKIKYALETSRLAREIRDLPWNKK